MKQLVLSRFHFNKKRNLSDNLPFFLCAIFAASFVFSNSSDALSVDGIILSNTNQLENNFRDVRFSTKGLEYVMSGKITRDNSTVTQGRISPLARGKTSFDNLKIQLRNPSDASYVKRDIPNVGSFARSSNVFEYASGQLNVSENTVLAGIPISGKLETGDVDMGMWFAGLFANGVQSTGILDYNQLLGVHKAKDALCFGNSKISPSIESVGGVIFDRKRNPGYVTVSMNFGNLDVHGYIELGKDPVDSNYGLFTTGLNIVHIDRSEVDLALPMDDLAIRKFMAFLEVASFEILEDKSIEIGTSG